MGETLTQAQKDELLAAHNAYRAVKCLPPLTWSDSAAATAQAWVTQCKGNAIVDHNPDRGFLGENNFASGGPASATSAVSNWASEGKSYDDVSHTCAAGEICGHYTQVMWKNTTQLGCGVAICQNLSYPYNLVCDYAPPGNYGGQNPY